MKPSTQTKDFKNQDVAMVFLGFPKSLVSQLMFLRDLIFETAATTAGVGELEETLRWGDPSYLTTQSKIGSVVRINSKGAKGTHYAVYFHCQTNLVETFRELYPNTFNFEGNRAILFAADDPVPVEPLRHCIALALTYHRDKRLLDAGSPTRAPGRARKAPRMPGASAVSRR